MRLELSGNQEIAAPAAAVWEKLIDHSFVAASAPGLESVEPVDSNRFRVIAGLGVGSIKLRFTLHLELFDLEPPAKLRIAVKGDAPGSAMRAEAGATLTPLSPASTRLDWTLAADVHGTIASIGARLLQGTVRKLTQGFWKKFASRVNAPLRKKKAAGKTKAKR